MFTNFDDFQKFAKGQIDASTAASATVSKGIQTMATETTDFTKKSIEAGSAAFDKLIGAKTLDSAYAIQQDYAKSAYEAFVAQTTKFGELYASFAKDVFKPVEAAFAKASVPVATSN